MSKKGEKTPRPEDVKRELNEFLSKRFGDQVQVLAQEPYPEVIGEPESPAKKNSAGIDFSLKPEDLTAYLDQYIVRQDHAKAVLATKICTHYNRVKAAQNRKGPMPDMVGGVKNNILMIGPTGVGKTYMIRLIAKRLGVPFVKGDATKFSETGYVGGDVEDLVRELVREADGDMELAQCGIIYIDEIDKIASAHNIHGADVSRSGVQRALLKPMEETEVDLKVPHDPVSMIQEIEKFRKSGKKDDSRINTRNILFIMSGAFNDLAGIIKKRVQDQGIGFGASVSGPDADTGFLVRVKAEDLINYGFESEFVGRLPIVAVLTTLDEQDLFHILKNPNNPLILGKKFDFGAYGIDIRFTDGALRLLASQASKEKTGARGLVSVMERALLYYEKCLPSVKVKKFTVTEQLIKEPGNALETLLVNPDHPDIANAFNKAEAGEREWIAQYVRDHQAMLSQKYDLKLTDSRISLIAELYSIGPTDIRNVLKQVCNDHGKARKLELTFFQEHGINIVLEEDAIDYLILLAARTGNVVEDYYSELSDDFHHGLTLVKEKTGKDRFFLPREALDVPEEFLDNLIRTNLKEIK